MELGDPSAYWAACDEARNEDQLSICIGTSRHPKRYGSKPLLSPRSGDVEDLWVLQQRLGFDIYRVNIHTNREVYDWRGSNLNERMSPQQQHFTPMHHVRSMRKLELLRRDTPREAFGTLLRMHQSLLITKEPLAAFVRHHQADLEVGAATADGQHLTLQQLNQGNPALARLAA